jgi:hypothetical protein
MRDPEVRLQIEAQVQKQIQGWVRTKVPALGGRTPLQAVADPDGREMVEALLPGITPEVRRPRRMPPAPSAGDMG